MATLYGTTSSEMLLGTLNADLIYADEGDDSLYGLDGDDQLFGEDGNDHLSGGGGDDLLDGGSGYDLVNYDTAASVIIDLSLQQGGHTLTEDHYVSIEGAIGSVFADQMTGDAGSNVFYGGEGKDVIYGGGGADQLYGGEGNDQLYGGAGINWIDGGYGVDYVRFDDVNRVIIDLENGVTANGDQLFNIENIFASGGDDIIFGDRWDNVIYGQEGDDYIVGLNGFDSIYGGPGSDTFGFDSDFGSDALPDFDPNEDFIKIQKHINGTDVVDYASLLPHMEVTPGGQLVINLGARNQIILTEFSTVPTDWTDSFIFF